MSSRTSPTVASWELALRLRQRRERLGIDAKTIAEAIGFTRNYWSAVENERKQLSEESLDKALEQLEFDRDDQAELRRLRATAKERGWWTRYSMLDPEVERLYGLEAGASSNKEYASILVPGLLQTADYARAIMTPAETIREVEVDQLVEVRLRRQELLNADPPLRLTALLSEAVLHQQIGGPDVLRGQLQHLVDMAEAHPHIDIHVIPFDVRACGLFGAATLRVLDFPSPSLPMLAYLETVTARLVLEDRITVRDITTTYNAAVKTALDTQESVKMIQRRIAGLTT
jgi:transcriptional regulator with XRE-family HTH domain